MKVIERAKAHLKSLGTRSIEVPEWPDDTGALTVIYWTPLTLEQKAQLYARNEGNDALLVYADVVASFAMDEAGKKLFDLQDKIDLRKAAESSVVQRIANAILAVPKVEEAEKN